MLVAQMRVVEADDRSNRMAFDSARNQLANATRYLSEARQHATHLQVCYCSFTPASAMLFLVSTINAVLM